MNVPLIGTVAAGQPILAVENIEGYFPVPSEFMPNEQSFILKVKGDSMVNAGIFDGDQVLVKQQPTADNGDIVVALVEDSATVKTFYKEKGYYRLQPENDIHGSYYCNWRDSDIRKSFWSDEILSVMEKRESHTMMICHSLFCYNFIPLFDLHNIII